MVTQLRVRCVKQGDLADAGRVDLLMALRERVQVQVADRAAGKPSELKMGEPVWRRQDQVLACDSRQVVNGDERTSLQPR